MRSRRRHGRLPRVLQHVTACPRKIGDIANAALILTHFEHRYLSR
jgi:hypothetical protein